MTEPLDTVRKVLVGLFTFWYQMTSLRNSLIPGSLAIVGWALAAIGLRRAHRGAAANLAHLAAHRRNERLRGNPNPAGAVLRPDPTLPDDLGGVRCGFAIEAINSSDIQSAA